MWSPFEPALIIVQPFRERGSFSPSSYPGRRSKLWPRLTNWKAWLDLGKGGQTTAGRHQCSNRTTISQSIEQREKVEGEVEFVIKTYNNLKSDQWNEFDWVVNRDIESDRIQSVQNIENSNVSVLYIPWILCIPFYAFGNHISTAKSFNTQSFNIFS